MLGIVSGADVCASLPDEVAVLESWSGIIADERLQRHAPTSEFLVDADEWSLLWNAWRPREPIPDVDFASSIILVFTAPGPNTVGCVPRLDSRGNLRAAAMSTLIGGPGFGYLFQRIPRAGVRTVNGRPLPGEAPLPRPPPQRRSPRPLPVAVPGSTGSPDGGDGTTTVSVAPAEPALSEIRDLVPPPRLFDLSSVDRPLRIDSEEEAVSSLGAECAAVILRQVEFDRQFVLVFAWRGSGGDRLDAAVAESWPEQIFFTYTPGRTRDAHDHLRAFALRSNVVWRVRRTDPRPGPPP